MSSTSKGSLRNISAISIDVRTTFISSFAMRVWGTQPFVVRSGADHSVRRTLRHFVTYGSTNRYAPVNQSKASGASGT